MVPYSRNQEVEGFMLIAQDSGCEICRRPVKLHAVSSEVASVLPRTTEILTGHESMLFLEGPPLGLVRLLENPHTL